MTFMRTFPSRKRKILIVFDDMIADVMTNKKFQGIIDAVFITQSYFLLQKCQIKLFDYENQPQKRITKCCD